MCMLYRHIIYCHTYYLYRLLYAKPKCLSFLALFVCMLMCGAFCGHVSNALISIDIVYTAHCAYVRPCRKEDKWRRPWHNQDDEKERRQNSRTESYCAWTTLTIFFAFLRSFARLPSRHRAIGEIARRAPRLVMFRVRAAFVNNALVFEGEEAGKAIFARATHGFVIA